MEKLLTDIQDRLAALPELKYVDQDWGQLDYYAAHPPAMWPACVVGFNNVQWQNQAREMQMGLATIRVRVADQRLTPSSSKASATQKDLALAIIRTLDAVTRALHGWSADASYSRLMRTATNRIAREDGLQVYEIIFTTEVYEDLSTPPVLVAAAPVISP